MEKLQRQPCSVRGGVVEIHVTLCFRPARTTMVERQRQSFIEGAEKWSAHVQSSSNECEFSHQRSEMGDRYAFRLQEARQNGSDLTLLVFGNSDDAVGQVESVSNVVGRGSGKALLQRFAHTEGKSKSRQLSPQVCSCGIEETEAPEEQHIIYIDQDPDDSGEGDIREPSFVPSGRQARTVEHWGIRPDRSSPTGENAAANYSFCNGRRDSCCDRRGTDRAHAEPIIAQKASSVVLHEICMCIIFVHP